MVTLDRRSLGASGGIHGRNGLGVGQTCSTTAVSVGLHVGANRRDPARRRAGSPNPVSLAELSFQVRFTWAGEMIVALQRLVPDAGAWVYGTAFEKDSAVHAREFRPVADRVLSDDPGTRKTPFLAPLSE